MTLFASTLRPPYELITLLALTGIVLPPLFVYFAKRNWRVDLWHFFAAIIPCAALIYLTTRYFQYCAVFNERHPIGDANGPFRLWYLYYLDNLLWIPLPIFFFSLFVTWAKFRNLKKIGKNWVRTPYVITVFVAATAFILLAPYAFIDSLVAGFAGSFVCCHYTKRFGSIAVCGFLFAFAVISISFFISILLTGFEYEPWEQIPFFAFYAIISWAIPGIVLADYIGNRWSSKTQSA